MTYKTARVDGKDLEKFLNDQGEFSFLQIFPIEGLSDYFMVIYAVKKIKVVINNPVKAK